MWPKGADGGAVGGLLLFQASHASITRDSNNLVTGCSSCTTALRITGTSFTKPNQPAAAAYWTHAAPSNLRVPYSGTAGNLITTLSYDGDTTANLTEMDQTDSSTTIKSLWTYQSNGNVLSATDPNANVTQLTYNQASNGCSGLSLYPNTVAAAGLTTSYTFDCTSGVLQSVTDPNSIKTSFTYDNIGRTIMVEQKGGSLDRFTTTTYDDVGLSVTTKQDDTGTNTLTKTNTTYLDAVGRVHSTLDAANNRVLKLYRYGAGGVSYELTSNP